MTLIHWVNQGRAQENSSYGLYMRVFWELQPIHSRPRDMLESGSKEFLVGALWSTCGNKSVGCSP